MRWDNLFDDLEGQLEQELGAEEVDLRAEEERLRLGRLALRDRLVALAGAEGGTAGDRRIRLILSGGAAITVRPVTFGRDWISGDLVEDSRTKAQFILPITAIAGLVLDRQQVGESIGEAAAIDPARGLSRRLGIGFVLRDLCRRRSSAAFLLGNGSLGDSLLGHSTVHGTIDRVGRDHFDIAVHEAGSARRDAQVSQYRVVPFTQLVLVRL